MNFCVVCAPCQECKYTDCVTVCPMDCFYQDEAMLYIDPLECIDCGACIPECPVNAICTDNEVPAKWHEYIQLNADRVLALKPGGGNITEKQDALLGPGCTTRP